MNKLRLGLYLLTAAAACGQTMYEFSDGISKQKLRLESGEAWVRPARGHSREAIAKLIRGAKAEEQGDGSLLLVMPAAADKQHAARLRSLAKSGAVSEAAPVLYDIAAEGKPETLVKLSPAEREQRHTAARHIATAKVLVKMADRERDSALIAKGRPAVSEETAAAPGYAILVYGSPWDALEAAQWMVTAAKLTATPMFARQMRKKWQQTPAYGGTLQRAVNDPLYPNQWHLGTSGVNVNLAAAWDFTTGEGVNVTVVDDGLQISHPDLTANAYPLATNYHRNFNGGDNGDSDPTPAKFSDAHGTSCGGIIGATAFNNLGVAGVAPGVRLMGLRLIAGPATDQDEAAAFGWQPDGIATHVSSNSWGPADDGATVKGPGPLALAALEKAATVNRNGLGTVVVVSAGNGRGKGDDSSFDGYASSRFTIAVGAVNMSGQQSSYSESGIDVAIAAPGGEFAPPDVIVTTNTTGSEANAALLANGGNAPPDYTDSFNGTSAAAPMVSGAAALLLGKYPALAARDVKEILIRSAKRDLLSGGDPFVANGAGLQFSHSFGAGLVNVAGALTLADTWQNLPPVKQVTAPVAAGNVDIPDGSNTGAVAAFSVTDDIRVEHVEFTVTLKHPNRGDLAFELTSPTGMKSVVPARPNDTGADFDNWTFTSVRHWGESSRGTWTVRIYDAVQNGASGSVQSVGLRIWGS